jgi:hypothetical protein
MNTVKSLAAGALLSAALLVIARTAHADDITDPSYCHDKPASQLTGDEATWWGVMKHFRGVWEKSRADAAARAAAVGGPPTEAERCYWTLPELRDGCDKTLENPFYSICIGTQASLGWCLRLERPFYLPSDKSYWEARIARGATLIDLDNEFPSVLAQT